MKIKSSIKIAGYELPIKVYSDGSVDVKLPTAVTKLFTDHTKQTVVLASLHCPAGLLAFRYFLDYMEDYYSIFKLEVRLTHIPNGRQDRLNGDKNTINLFSLKSVGKLLKSPSIDTILVVDPHSYVSLAVLDKTSSVSQYLAAISVFDRFSFETDLLVAPDSGAFNKTKDVAAALNRPYTMAIKTRNPVTNELTDTQLLGDVSSISGLNVTIVDDLLDGGRTFNALAKVLKEAGAKTVSLYVTHGIFSYGYESLKEHIDQIFVYYNWLSPHEVDSNFIKTYLYTGDSHEHLSNS